MTQEEQAESFTTADAKVERLRRIAGEAYQCLHHGRLNEAAEYLRGIGLIDESIHDAGVDRNLSAGRVDHELPEG